jgi:hypothetical protein
MKIYARHLRGRFCVRKSKLWAERHGFDFRDFVRNGIDADKLLATGDHQAAELVRAVKEEKHGRLK